MSREMVIRVLAAIRLARAANKSEEDIARAVIETMREPTEAMEKAGARAWDDDLCTETNALNMWQAMVDEGLK